MAMFLGVAGVQWASGVAAGWAPLLGTDPVTAALGAVALLLALGTGLYAVLPWPDPLKRASMAA